MSIGTPMIPGLQLPPYERQTSSGTTQDLPGSGSDTRKELNPDQVEAQRKQDELLEQEKRLAQQKRDQLAAENDVKADVAGKLYEAAGKVGVEREKLLEQTDNDIGTWRKRLRTANDEYTSQPLPRLFGDQSEGRRVLLTLMSIGAAVAGGARTEAMMRAGMNPGDHSTVDDIIKGDFARQKAKLEQLSDRVLMAKMGVADAVEARKLALADLDVKEAAVYGRLEKLQRARLASLGQSAADIEQSKDVVGAQQRREEARMRAVDGLTTTLEERHGKTRTSNVSEVNRSPSAPTGGAEGQKLDIQQQRIRENGTELLPDVRQLTNSELAAIQRIQKTDAWADKNVTMDALLGQLGVDKEGGASERVKRVLRAAAEVTDAKITMDTGAVASPDQVRNGMRLIIPGPDATTADVENSVHKLQQVIGNYGRPRSPAATTPASPGAAATPGAPPPPATPQESDRDRAIRIFKAKPALWGTKEGVKMRIDLGIRKEDLGG